MRHKCGRCGRYIKWESRIATEYQIEDCGYPEKYDVPVCEKCGELQGHEVEGERHE